MKYRTCPTILSSPDHEYSERHTGQDDEDTKQGANNNSNALFHFLLQKSLGYEQFKQQTLRFSLEKDKDCHNKNQVKNGSSYLVCRNDVPFMYVWKFLANKLLPTSKSCI